jgi:hypothetical protein
MRARAAQGRVGPGRQILLRCHDRPTAHGLADSDPMLIAARKTSGRNSIWSRLRTELQ